MKLLFNNLDGRIFYSVYDSEYFRFTHTTNIGLTEFEVDEIGTVNKITCRDLAYYGNDRRTDVNGDPKYHMVDNAGTWELHERDGWEEFIEE